MTEAVLAVPMKSCDSARPAVLSPKFRIDPAVGIERRDHDIGDAGIAFRAA
jgi:hypothetical protein